MSETTLAINFPPALRDWITQRLQRGGAPDQMAQALASQGYDPLVARELVAAFARAYREGAPLPRDSITVSRVKPAAPGVRLARLGRGTLLRAADRHVRVLSRMDQPAVAVLEGVLSHDECDALVAMAQPRLAPSTTVDPSTGFTVVSDERTSHGVFFRLQENALVARIDQRISALMRLPVEHGEGLQVLRYGVGAQSTPHYDFLMPTNAANQASLARSGQRVSTLVVYPTMSTPAARPRFPRSASRFRRARAMRCISSTAMRPASSTAGHCTPGHQCRRARNGSSPNGCGSGASCQPPARSVFPVSARGSNRFSASLFLVGACPCETLLLRTCTR
ncbi:2-oxoglutarate-dependent dioxygenase [Cupriavidus necator]